MIKLSVVKTEYFTNFKKQTVTCKLTYRIKVTDRKMVYLINYIGGFVDNSLCIGDTYTVVSTAKTLPDDKFDIHKGEQIARAKAGGWPTSRPLASRSFPSVAWVICPRR